MKYSNKLFAGFILGLALACAMPMAQAASTIYNFTIMGDVLVGDEWFANAYNLTEGESITATGTFTADLGIVGSETGAISFANGSGNTMTINLNGTLLYATDDDDYGTGGGPTLTFAGGLLTDFDFMKTSSPSFNSSFLAFDDFDSMYGEWTSVSLAAVPVPAAVWLFGSGLLGLVGIAKRKRK